MGPRFVWGTLSDSAICPGRLVELSWKGGTQFVRGVGW